MLCRSTSEIQHVRGLLLIEMAVARGVAAAQAFGRRWVWWAKPARGLAHLPALPKACGACNRPTVNFQTHFKLLSDGLTDGDQQQNDEPQTQIDEQKRGCALTEALQRW